MNMNASTIYTTEGGPFGLEVFAYSATRFLCCFGQLWSGIVAAPESRRGRLALFTHFNNGCLPRAIADGALLPEGLNTPVNQPPEEFWQKLDRLALFPFGTTGAPRPAARWFARAKTCTEIAYECLQRAYPAITPGTETLCNQYAAEEWVRWQRLLNKLATEAEGAGIALAKGQ